MLRQKTTVTLLKAVSGSCKPKVKKYWYLLWIPGKRASQGLSWLLQLVLKMLKLQKLLLSLHLSSHFWQDRRCSNSQPGSSGLVVAFSSWDEWQLTLKLWAAVSMGLVCRELKDSVAGRAQVDPRTHHGHALPAVPQAKMTPQASYSILLIDPECKQDEVTQKLSLDMTCGTTVDKHRKGLWG